MIITDSTCRDGLGYPSIVKIKVKYDFDDLDENVYIPKDVKSMNKENEFIDLLNEHFNNKLPSYTEVGNFISQNSNEIINQLKNTPKSNDNRLRTFEFYYNVSIDGSEENDIMLVDLYHSDNELYDFISDLFNIGEDTFYLYYDRHTNKDQQVYIGYEAASRVITNLYKQRFGNTIPTMEEFKNFILQNKDEIGKEVIKSVNETWDELYDEPDQNF